MVDRSDEGSETGTDDVRSALAAAFTEHEAPVETVETPAEEPERPSRARAPDGKFAKADEAPEAEAVEAKPEPAKAETAEEQPETAPTGKEAPANWSADDKAMFGNVPAEAQEFLLRRHQAMEADYTRKTQAIAEFQRDFEPVSQMFAPHKQIMRDKGFTPATLIQSWYNVEKALVDGKGLDIIDGLIKGYNIDPKALAARLGIAANPPQPDGQTPAAQLPPELLTRLTRTEQFIADQQRAAQQREQEAHLAKQNQVMGEIEQFATAKDKSGQPLHPHFDEVQDQMAILATAAKQMNGTVPPLAELYDQAVWANPSVRAKQIAAERAASEAQHKAAEKQRQEEARAKAEKSARAGSSVTGSPGTGQTAQAKRTVGSIRDELEAAMEDNAA